MQNNPNSKAGYKKVAAAWQGVIRNAQNEIIWECLHRHHNRDQSTQANGVSATDCAKQAILHGAKDHGNDPARPFATQMEKRS